MHTRIKHPFASTSRLRNRKIATLDAWLDNPILDIGAGAGQYTKTLRSLGYEVDCIEPDKSVRDPTLSYGVNHACYRTGLLINVLHHLTEDAEEFISKYLKTCDILVVGELNGDSWLVRLYHRLFVRDEIGLHYPRAKFLRLMDKFYVLDFWVQGLGPFTDTHLFAVISKKEVIE